MISFENCRLRRLALDLLSRFSPIAAVQTETVFLFKNLSSGQLFPPVTNIGVPILIPRD